MRIASIKAHSQPTRVGSRVKRRVRCSISLASILIHDDSSFRRSGHCPSGSDRNRRGEGGGNSRTISTCLISSGRCIVKVYGIGVLLHARQFSFRWPVVRITAAFHLDFSISRAGSSSATSHNDGDQRTDGLDEDDNTPNIYRQWYCLPNNSVLQSANLGRYTAHLGPMPAPEHESRWRGLETSALVVKPNSQSIAVQCRSSRCHRVT